MPRHRTGRIQATDVRIPLRIASSRRFPGPAFRERAVGGSELHQNLEHSIPSVEIEEFLARWGSSPLASPATESAMELCPTRTHAQVDTNPRRKIRGFVLRVTLLDPPQFDLPR